MAPKVEAAAVAEPMEDEAVEPEDAKEVADADMLAKDEQEHEEEPAKELELDAEPIKGAQLEDGSCVFHTEDTTLNVMPAANGKMLMSLADGGFQYLLAGARGSVGLKAGRYMFEVAMTEFKAMAENTGRRGETIKGPAPRNLMRVGLALEEASLLLATDGESSVCFDSEGSFFDGSRTTRQVGAAFDTGDVIALVLNLDASSPNGNTVSLFVNGSRASQPQPLPEAFKGKALFPAVTYRNITSQVNFGPVPLRPLPFACHMVSQAAVADSVQRKAFPEPKDGRYEVLVPVGLPDEGTYDWLDQFLAKNRSYTELSDRALFQWAEKSGLKRVSAPKRNCVDKPEFNFGLTSFDDPGLWKVVMGIAPLLQRNLVVMEVRGNLLTESRKKLLEDFPAHGFRKVAKVVMGEPPEAWKAWVQTVTLQEKQAKADEIAQQKAAEAARRKAAEEARKKRMAEQKKRIEEAKKARAVKKGEESKETEETETKDEDEEEAKAEEAKQGEEEAEEAPKVELTAEEKTLKYRKRDVQDLSAKDMSANYVNFSIPGKEEGFDEITFEWDEAAACQAYMQKWVLDKKLTQRVEDLQPSDWFNERLSEWSKSLAAWKKKLQDFKDATMKKQESARRKAEETAAKEGKTDEGEAEEGAEDKDNDKKEAEKEEVQEKAKDEEEEVEPAKPEVDLDTLDVFAVEDVADVGSGEPLFSKWSREDWAMLSLRFELHLLLHAYRRDLNDPERQTFHEKHLMYYYNRYFRKTFNTRNFGASTTADLAELCKDVIEIDSKNATLLSQMEDDTPLDNFVKLTEDDRRDRLLRFDLGDDKAILHFSRDSPQHRPYTQKPAPTEPRMPERVSRPQYERPAFHRDAPGHRAAPAWTPPAPPSASRGAVAPWHAQGRDRSRSPRRVAVSSYARDARDDWDARERRRPVFSSAPAPSAAPSRGNGLAMGGEKRRLPPMPTFPASKRPGYGSGPTPYGGAPRPYGR